MVSNVSCEEQIVMLEIENSGHQIFKNPEGVMSEEWISLIKNLAVLADYYQIDDLIFAFKQYIYSSDNDEKKDIIFQTKILNYQNSFHKILKLFKKMETYGIDETPISVSYGIEEWVVKWNEYDSYSFLRKLRQWFEIDFDKIVSLQNNTEISYDTAVSILENIKSWRHETQLLKMVIQFKFNIAEENRVYTSLELCFDVLAGCEYPDVDFINSVEIFISAISINTLKKNVKKYWEKFKYDPDADLYYSSSGEEITYDSALTLGIEPDSKSFWRNAMIERLHEYNLSIRLPNYISRQV